MIKNLTEGKPLKLLFFFSLPMLMGNLFQQLYNMVDSIVVGNFVGADALAAVGASFPVVFLAVALASGLSMGCNVVISQLFGAGRIREMKTTISTALIGQFVLSIGITIVGEIISPGILRMLKTPDNIMADSLIYLRIYLGGAVFLFIYNTLNGIYNALGDSKTPLYFLVTSAFLNIFGDLFFVVVLRWGVAGSAIATVCSEGLCCLLCGIYIKKKIPLLCLGKKWWVFDKSLLGKTVSYGSTSAMQQVCLQLGKLIIQSVVNTQGVAVMAAFTAVNRVDDFAYTPQQNIGHAMTTFLAQNKGAGHKERMKKGFQTGLLIELVYSIGLFCVIWGLAPQIMTLFAEDGDAQVVSLGISYLHLISWMYILPGLTNGVQGFFRGIGDLKVTLYSTFMNMFGRVVAVFVMIRLLQMEFASLAWANMVGWIVMLLFEVPLLVKSMRNGECG